LNKKTLDLICSTTCLIPNAVDAVELKVETERERERESKLYSITFSFQPCDHVTGLTK